ncbi:MAG TPA: RecQ family ATP-dependent DNA helicase [Pseudonocardia sp.]|nr:RecQ family ATP-dependent DNA helicase [Pseudonocardia sp.]
MSKQEDELRRIAKETFGWDRLRGEQLRAMRALVAGQDVLVVLPTGAGKSAIYQVPALELDGPTLVVSPLIALQQDQLRGIADSDAPEAVAVNSAQGGGQQRRAWQAVRQGNAEYLFLSPEQLAKEEVIEELAEMGVALFVVDEAHCVSAWGHDFRPDYLRLGAVIERLGHPRVLALTATAGLPVRRDIVSRLGMREPEQVVASFDRPNLRLVVERLPGDEEKRQAVLSRVTALTSDPATRPGLVYVGARKDTEYYADQLAAAGVRVAAYHAGMKAAQRKRVHAEFLDGQLDVVVATSAFGMGIDKPDVRFVLHASVPESLDSYYQQVGRAGRDERPAEVSLFYRPEDLALQKFLTASGAPEDALGEVVGAMREHGEPLRPTELKDRIEASGVKRTRAVNLLEQAEVLSGTADGRLCLVDPELPPPDAVSRALEVAEAHQRLIRSRIEMIREYAETTRCRRQFLLGYFGERLTEPCGNCDTCAAGTATALPEANREFPLNSTVRHVEWGRGVVMNAGDDRITALFDEAGYKTLSLEANRAHRVLTLEGAGDAG